MFPKTALLVALALAGAATSANASLVSANIVYDLSTKVDNGTNSWRMAFDPLTSTVNVNNGDTVALHISFLPGQALQWNGNGRINPWLGVDSVGTFGWSHASIDFLGLIGPALLTPIADGTSCCAHIGPTYAINGDGIAREFTGINVAFDVSLNGPKTFSELGWIPLFQDGTVHSVAAHSVPEPATLALVGLGLFGLAAGRRRMPA